MSKVSRTIGEVITEKTRFRISRKFSERERKLMASHSRHLGEILNAYNAAHAALFLLFWRVGAKMNYDLAISLWHTAKSDRAQRDMLEAFVANEPDLNNDFKSAILWAIGILNELSGFRNDAAHTEMTWYYDKLIPGLSTKRQTRERISNLPFEKQWLRLKGDLIAMRAYLVFIDISLSSNVQKPLTQKPRLRLARSTSQQTQKQRRQAKIAIRERQRRSSQE